jgi:hypothetical protein
MPVMSADVRQLDDWVPTPAAVRDAVLDCRVGLSDISDAFAMSPDAVRSVPGEAELEALVYCAHDAVAKGRMISFGDWTNAAIMRGGKRGGPLWNRDALALPFLRPWLFMHRWDPQNAVDAAISQRLGMHTRPGSAVAAYLVVPHDRDLLACELVPVKYNGVGMLDVGDRVMLHRNTVEDPEHRYHATAAPAMARFLMQSMTRPGEVDPAHDAAANVLDPLMLALLMLNTKGVARSTVAFSDKLQRARAKCGKAPLPPYDEVDSDAYITAITLSGESRARGPDQGGTHRSPTPHIRRGHFREYQSGVKAIIADTLVNVPPEQRAKWKQGRRSHYEVH